MAQKLLLATAITVVVAATLHSLATATEHVVGADMGWTLGFNYTAWAEGREFLVGDTLVFNYKPGVHNVIKANAQGFGSCEAPSGVQALETGKDVIPLASPGAKFYFCGKPNHCESGMKLAITVVANGLQTPAATPPSVPPTPGSATMVAAAVHGSLVALAMAIVMG